MTHTDFDWAEQDFEKHSSWMRRLAQGLVGEAGADDLVQDAWTRVGSRRENRGYLASVVRSLAFKRRRGEERRRRREELAAKHEALPSTEECASRTELLRVLSEALDQLEEPYRRILVLRYFDGLSAAEIARRAGLPSATVRTRARRGLELLRARLDEHTGQRDLWVSAFLPWALPDARLEPSQPGPLPKLVWLAGSAGLAVGLLAFLKRQDGSAVSLAPKPQPAQVVAEDSSTILDELNAPRRLGREAGQGELPFPQPSIKDEHQRFTLSLRVQDEEGLPVDSAWITPARSPRSKSYARDGALLLELPEQAGLWRSPHYSNGLSVFVGAPGFAHQELFVPLPEDPTAIELGSLTLEPGAKLSGRIVDSSGLGIEGARVVFGLPQDPYSRGREPKSQGPHELSLQLRASLATRSGGGGAFVIEGAPVGFGVLWASAPNTYWAFTEPLGVREGEHLSGLELTLEDASSVSIRGALLDPEGRPLVGHRIGLTNAGDARPHRTVLTDELGGFTYLLPNPTPPDTDEFVLQAEPPIWEWNSLRTKARRGEQGLALRFENAQWLGSRVVDPQGRPVIGATVGSLDEAGSRELPRGSSRVNTEGKGLVRRPSHPFTLQARAPGYRASAVLGPYLPEAFPDELTIVLEPAESLHGTVLDPEGNPLPGAVVSLLRGPSEDSVPAYKTHSAWNGRGPAFVYRLSPRAEAEGRTDAEGRFRLALPGTSASDGSFLKALGYLAASESSEEPESIWYVHVHAPGWGSLCIGPRTAEEWSEATELRLVPGGQLHGQLTIAGTSTTGWTVRACNGGPRVHTATLDAEGRFLFQHLAPGPWQVRAFEPRAHFDLGAVTEAATQAPKVDVVITARKSHELNLQLEPAPRARLRGRLWIDEEAPGAWLVRSYRQGQVGGTASLDPDGRFELELQPGPNWTLTLVPVTAPSDSFRIEARLDLKAGSQDWSLDLETGFLSGTCSCTESQLGSPRRRVLQYESQRPGLVFRAEPRLRVDRSFGPLRLPTGAGTLIEACRRQDPQVVAEFVLRDGQTWTYIAR